jgi:hypothetical protein
MEESAIFGIVIEEISDNMTLIIHFSLQFYDTVLENFVHFPYVFGVVAFVVK